MPTKWFILLTVLALSLTSAWAETPPLLQNGGFADWQAAPANLQQAINCQQLPVGWSLNPGLKGKQYTLLCDNNCKHGGESAAQLSNTDTKGGCTLVQRLDVEPETRYKIRLWLRGEKIDDYHPKGAIMTVVASGQRDKRDLNMWADVLKVTDIAPSPGRGTFDWKETVGIIDTPVNTRTIVISIALRGAGTLWVDDVDVTRVEKCIQVESY
ncbi:MAG TPA: hypothetical protein VGM23_14210 [Armatimonadota bacterium]|jgi:hypothetical protein